MNELLLLEKDSALLCQLSYPFVWFVDRQEDTARNPFPVRSIPPTYPPALTQPLLAHGALGLSTPRKAHAPSNSVSG